MTLPAPYAAAPVGHSRWTSFHLHAASNAQSVIDRVVTEAVGPVAGGRPWFFIRYWQGGPHVRLRLAGLDAAEVARTEAELTRLLADAGRLRAAEQPLSTGDYRADATRFAANESGADRHVQELRPPGVHPATYEPETERYGGAALMPRTEELFQLSSELVLALLPHVTSAGARSALALRATISAAAALGGPEEQAAYYANSVVAWRSWAAGFGCTPEQLDRLCSVEGTRGGAAATDPARHGPFGSWHTGLGDLVGEIRATTQVHPGQILFSHVHMLHNRLGRSLFDELRTYAWLAHHFPATGNFPATGSAGATR
ncbi:thiopeptide-type bacteriocin biosynthesis protein [Streptomyces kanamyceticus]|uniref:thiopeptide-type bacteriocin biosynthesis protein n=1 Tax=Streptomyces kanamyceticus TaxID=1967 RepID=UPI0006E36ED8|nr:thiopeptide-type bacteriocin biosynthesis protein [Streptomyces kanamyceticus]